MSSVVLDASAILALLNEEPGGDVVQEALAGAVVGAVNLSEVIAKLIENGMPEEEIRTSLGGLGLEIQPFDEEMAMATALLRPKTKKLGLGLGDRACLALGLRLSTPVLTADRTWLGLKVGVEVRVIRPERQARGQG